MLLLSECFSCKQIYHFLYLTSSRIFVNYLQDTLQHCQGNIGLHWGYSKCPFFAWIYNTLSGTVQELCWNHRSQSPISVLQDIVAIAIWAQWWINYSYRYWGSIDINYRCKQLLIGVSLLKVSLHWIIHYSFCLDLVCIGEVHSDVYLTLNRIIFNIIHRVPLDLLLPWEWGWVVLQSSQVVIFTFPTYSN